MTGARSVFQQISNVLIDIDATFGHPGEATHYRIHCPMAFDDAGADWLQTDTNVRNPYFGARMLRCGNVTDTFAPGER